MISIAVNFFSVIFDLFLNLLLVRPHCGQRCPKQAFEVAKALLAATTPWTWPSVAWVTSWQRASWTTHSVRALHALLYPAALLCSPQDGNPAAPTLLWAPRAQCKLVVHLNHHGHMRLKQLVSVKHHPLVIILDTTFWCYRPSESFSLEICAHLRKWAILHKL